MIQSVIHGFTLGLLASPSCPSNAEEIRLGTRYGLKHALTVGVGAVAGDAIVLIVLLLGIAPVLERVQALSTALWVAGALVLTYVAWGIFKEAAVVEGVEGGEGGGRDHDVVPTATAARSLPRAFWVGFAITTFNPFTIVWWLGLLGPALTQSRGVPASFVVAVLVGSLAWFVALAFLLHLGRRWLTRRVRRWVLVLSGVGASGYALYFLWRAVREIGL